MYSHGLLCGKLTLTMENHRFQGVNPLFQWPGSDENPTGAENEPRRDVHAPNGELDSHRDQPLGNLQWRKFTYPFCGEVWIQRLNLYIDHSIS